MQCFLVGYRGTCHLYFLRIHTRLKARVYTENTSDAWHIPRYPTRKHCIIGMYGMILQPYSLLHIYEEQSIANIPQGSVHEMAMRISPR